MSLFFQYRRGNVGIIISIPHGGLKDVPSIPERSDGYESNNIVQDINVSSCQVFSIFFIRLNVAYSIYPK